MEPSRAEKRLEARQWVGGARLYDDYSIIRDTFFFSFVRFFLGRCPKVPNACIFFVVVVVYVCVQHVLTFSSSASHSARGFRLSTLQRARLRVENQARGRVPSRGVGSARGHPRGHQVER